MQGAAKVIADQLKSFQRVVKEVQEIDHEAELNTLQRKMIKDVVVEILTPVQRNMNVENKAIRKILEEQGT